MLSAMSKIQNIAAFVFVLVVAVACESKKAISSDPISVDSTLISKDNHSISDDSLLTIVEKSTFQYFWDGAEPSSGGARERFHVNGDYPDHDKNVVNVGGTGFGIMAIIVGIERKFITREEGIKRFEKLTTFL